MSELVNKLDGEVGEFCAVEAISEITVAGEIVGLDKSTEEPAACASGKSGREEEILAKVGSRI